MQDATIKARQPGQILIEQARFSHLLESKSIGLVIFTISGVIGFYRPYSLRERES
jgi:hypothetical protein